MERRAVIALAVVLAAALILVLVEYPLYQQRMEEEDKPEGGFFYNYFTKNSFTSLDHNIMEDVNESKNTTEISNTTEAANITDAADAPKEEHSLVKDLTARIKNTVGRGEKNETGLVPDGAVTKEGEFDSVAFRALVENQTGVSSDYAVVDAGNGTTVVLPIPAPISDGLEESGLKTTFNRFLNLSIGPTLGRLNEELRKLAPYGAEGVVWIGNQSITAVASVASGAISLFLASLPAVAETVKNGAVVATDLTGELFVPLFAFGLQSVGELAGYTPKAIEFVGTAIAEDIIPPVASLAVVVGNATVASGAMILKMLLTVIESLINAVSSAVSGTQTTIDSEWIDTASSGFESILSGGGMSALTDAIGGILGGLTAPIGEPIRVTEYGWSF